MEKYFECFNCKDLMDTIYESKCCGILYCQNCKMKLSNSKCLKCCKLLEFQKNIFAQRLLKNINVKCKYGCGISLPYDKMKPHLLTCDKKIYTCSFDKIYNDNLNKQPFKGNKKEILDHLVKEHSHILLIFMENHQNFEPILKQLIKNNYNKNEQKKEDTILDLTNSGNFNLDLFRNNESEGNTSIDLDQDIRLLNGINELNIINSHLQNFNDLQLNNHNRRRNNHNSHNNHNHNHQNRNNNNDIIINNRINSLNSENSDNEIDNDNNNENMNLNNNINLLDVDLSRNHYQPLRELRFNSLFNDNENDNVNDNLNLNYRFNINNNNNSEHNSNNINGHINNTRNRRRIGNLLNNNQNNNNLNSNINSNIINNEGNNINNQNSNNF